LRPVRRRAADDDRIVAPVSDRERREAGLVPLQESAHGLGSLQAQGLLMGGGTSEVGVPLAPHPPDASQRSAKLADLGGGDSGEGRAIEGE
jgi:hypothetical protein